MISSEFEEGPAINDSVLAWLDRYAIGRIVLLPVEVHVSPFGVEASYLRAGETKIRVRLDTGALSMNLPMHLKSICSSYPCLVLLEGKWGPLVGTASDTDPVFAVLQVRGLAGSDATNVRLRRTGG